jgi:hypothetical protein
MAQEVYFVNCPHHGGIVEVVCPSVDRIAWKVEAVIGMKIFNSADSAHDMKCPECGKEMRVYWYLRSPR